MWLRENTERGRHVTGSATGMDQTGPFRAPYLSSAGHQAFISALFDTTQRIRISTDSGAHRLGFAVWSLRLSADTYFHACRWPAGEPLPGVEDLVLGGPESAAQAAQSISFYGSMMAPASDRTRNIASTSGPGTSCSTGTRTAGP